MNAAAGFRGTALEAERTFEQAAVRIGARYERFPHPLPGPLGEIHATAVARIGPADATAALVLISGVHGVEGFAGSGIQCGLLADPAALPLPAGMAMVLVHLVNPWGMAWSRREDHENIDPFRNLLYHDAPITPDPLFDEIEEALDLPNWDNPRRSVAKRQALAERYGVGRLIAAIRRGQHHRPKGMTYHGTGPGWSTRTLHTIVDRYLAGMRRVAVIDVHTGFGDFGQGMVMSYEPPESTKYQRARGWVADDFYTPGSDDDIPAHQRAPYQFIEDRIPGSTVTAVILEFGTEPPDITRDLFPANAYHHLYGNPRSDEALAVGARYRKFCYPETDEWKAAVWARGLTVVRQVASGLAVWNAEG